MLNPSQPLTSHLSANKGSADYEPGMLAGLLGTLPQQALAGESEDQISPRNFRRLAAFILDYSGIKMPDSKKNMLEGRLRRRLRATGISRFDDYCDYVFDEGGLGEEAVHLIDVVTTNKTDFFREPTHFDWVQRHVLPDLAARGIRHVRAWSAACSVGAEPYTLAMVMADYTERNGGMDFHILGTDLSTDVLEKAVRAIYPLDMMMPVPPAFYSRYVMTARDSKRQEARIVPKLRARVGFARLNLMDQNYRMGEAMQMIFCRNVLIYFDKRTQAHVLSRLVDCLEPGGYLFIGHSETIAGVDLPLKQLASTVFQKV